MRSLAASFLPCPALFSRVTRLLHNMVVFLSLQKAFRGHHPPAGWPCHGPATHQLFNSLFFFSVLQELLHSLYSPSGPPWVPPPPSSAPPTIYSLCPHLPLSLLSELWQVCNRMINDHQSNPPPTHTYIHAHTRLFLYPHGDIALTLFTGHFYKPDTLP